MDKVEIRESDKPFILAIVSAGITMLTVAISGIGAYCKNQEMVNIGFELLKFTFPLTTMAWGFYFSRRGER